MAAAASLVTVVALTPLFRNLPEAVLGALIIHAVSHLMRFAKLKAVLRLSPTEFWLGITALAGVIFIDVLQGLVIAMAASLLLVIYRSSRPSIAVLGELADRPGSYGALDLNPGASSQAGVLVLRLDAPMYYASAASNRDALKRLVTSAVPPVRVLILDLEVQHRVDVTSIDMTRQLAGWLHGRGIEVFLTHLHRDLRQEAEHDELFDQLGADHLLATIPAAMARLGSPAPRG